MKIDLTTGLLTDVVQLTSPHCDERPSSTVIDMIVVHGISLPPGQFMTGSIETFFCGQLDSTTHPYFDTIKELRVSAHVLINRLGGITQFVPFTKRAWHAGVSSFKGKERCNDFSIGIELEGTNDLPYEKIQYTRLANLITLLQKAYPAISRERIVGHSDIAPGRKEDPGPHFSWAFLDTFLEGSLA